MARVRVGEGRGGEGRVTGFRKWVKHDFLFTSGKQPYGTGENNQDLRPLLAHLWVCEETQNALCKPVLALKLGQRSREMRRYPVALAMEGCTYCVRGPATFINGGSP